MDERGSGRTRLPLCPSLNRLSAVEWFWTTAGLLPWASEPPTVSIAFRLWSGFGLADAAERVEGADESQSPFGCGVVLDREIRLDFHLAEGLNRLSAVEWFWTNQQGEQHDHYNDGVSIAFRLWSGFGPGTERTERQTMNASQSPFGCGVVLDPAAPGTSRRRRRWSQSPFGCGVVLDRRVPATQDCRSWHGLNRLSAVEWFWTQLLQRTTLPPIWRVSIAFRLWSGFGLSPIFPFWASGFPAPVRRQGGARGARREKTAKKTPPENGKTCPKLQPIRIFPLFGGRRGVFTVPVCLRNQKMYANGFSGRSTTPAESVFFTHERQIP